MHPRLYLLGLPGLSVKVSAASGGGQVIMESLDSFSEARTARIRNVQYVLPYEILNLRC